MRAATCCALSAAWLALCGCESTLRGGLREREAEQLVLALDQHAIAAEKQPEASGPAGSASYRVTVATADITRALRALEAERLLAPRPPGFEELYREPGLVSTPEEERARTLAATAGELTRSLERLPGVLSARVHIAPGQTPQQLDGVETPPTASVLLERRRAARALDEAAIRGLIAGAVTGIRASGIVIVQTEAAALADKPRYAYLGPIAIARESAALLRTLLAALLALDLVLGGLLVALLRRQRRQTTLEKS